MYYSVALTVLSSAMYHFLLKQTSTKLSPVLVLFWSYILAAAACLIVLLLKKEEFNMLSVFKDRAHIPMLLALALVGIEFGYIWSYKNGGQVGQVSMITQMTSLLFMMVLGFIFMKTPITVKSGLGIVSALLSFHMLR